MYTNNAEEALTLLSTRAVTLFPWLLRGNCISETFLTSGRELAGGSIQDRARLHVEGRAILPRAFCPLLVFPRDA